MKTHLLISLFILFSINMVAQTSNNKYENEWKKVQKLDSDRLPQSAIKCVNTILQKAIEEKNNTQVLKALIYKNKYKSNIDWNDREGVFTDLENLAAQTSDICEKALLDNMLAELYADYYSRNNWEINRRRQLLDLVPEDMKEWSSNIFINKTIEKINASIKDADILKNHNTKEFDDIITLGENKGDLYPTLYDFLMGRSIEILKMTVKNDIEQKTIGVSLDQLTLPAADYVKLNIPAGENNQNMVFIYFQQYMKDLLDRKLTSTLVFNEIFKIEFLSEKSWSFRQEKAINSYIRLTEIYAESDICAEVIYKLHDAYENVSTEGYKDKQYEWLQKGIERYPNSYGAILLKTKLYDMAEPQLNIEGERLIYPKDQGKLTIRYKNIQALDEKPLLKLYKIVGDEQIFVKDFPVEFPSEKIYNYNTLTINLPVLDPGTYFFTHLSDSYLIKSKNDPKSYPRHSSSFDFKVSALKSFYRNHKKGEYEIFVVDDKTGKPIENAEIEIYSQKNDNKPEFLAKLNTNDLGLAGFERQSSDSHQYKIRLGADSCLDMVYLYENYNWRYYQESSNTENDSEQNTISAFTDRSIYRPGQTVFFKAIILDRNGKPLKNKSFEVDLYNANEDLISKKEINTNEFGSVSGEFILPKSGLTGSFHIRINNEEYVYFRVEEYKRPTFSVKFEKLEETYSFGEKVTLKGYARNFSGINLQDAKVSYSISRSLFSPWGWGGDAGSTFDEGEVVTKEDGSFEVTFTPEPADKPNNLFRVNDKNIYTFKIDASVTDLNGETQSEHYSLSVGNVSMVIDAKIPEKVEKSEEYKLTIEAQNLEGRAIETSGSYVLYSLDDNDSIKGKELFGEFKTGEEQSYLKEKLKTRPSGKYRLEIKALDSKSNEITEKKDFILFSYSDKKPPFKTNDWLIEKNVTFKKDGKPAEVIFGISENDVYLLYTLYNNKTVFERKFVRLSNSNKLFSIPYRSVYGDGVNMSLAFVKNGMLYEKSVSLKKEEEKIETDLILKLEVFRDKLRPGQMETWTMSVKDSNYKPVMSELLASMYDSSLDQLYPYTKWNLNRPEVQKPEIYTINLSDRYFHRKDNANFRLSYMPSLFEIKERSFDIINWFEYINYHRSSNLLVGKINPPSYKYMNTEEGYVVFGSSTTQRKVSVVGAISTISTESLSDALAGNVAGIISEQTVANEDLSEFWIRGIGTFGNSSKALIIVDGVEKDFNDINIDDIETFSVLKDAGATAIYGSRGANGVIIITSKKKVVEKVRENFNETAFFYPQLRTNEKGETLISFTVPESNTTWRFRALAHDKEAKVGTLEQMVVTRKELMVTPNMPRFVRQGDKTSISTKISNLSENVISGEVRIEFFDPVSDKPIDLNIANQKQAFSIDKDASSSASWTFYVPLDIDVIGCRIVAENEDFSDGEQHALAVLSNRMLVTEAMPIDIIEEGTSSFTLDKLYNNKSETISNYKLTLEYSSNPAWYAVQALPTFWNPSNDNAVSWIASYYVNTLGASILQQYPKVEAMIKAWKNEGEDKQTLVSKLENNKELKTVLLEETPWVLDAKNETEQMERLSLLLDLNNSKQQADAATRKLSELKSSEGGWSWYKEMPPSRSITGYILHCYAKLQRLAQAEYPQEIKQMQIEGIRFLDNEIKRDFDNLKKHNKDWEKTTYISSAQLEYAYVRSSYRDIPIEIDTREAERFYVSVASKNWKQLGLYEQGLLSIILNRDGDKILAKKITNSIREHAIKDKSGMYWPNNKGSAFLTMSAVNKHTYLMEALEENGVKKDELNLLNRWLINQKRTQIWESTPASINAISTLLRTQKEWFSEETTPAEIKLGGAKVEPESKNMGTGYIKTSWNKSEVKNEMGKVEVSTSNSQPAYGAMYWQYYENLDKISEQKGELNVGKQLFKETSTTSGKGLTQIAENNPLAVGDKVIVRLTIRSDKDLEFVHLKDMRAPCFEPQQVLSNIKWENNLMYYQSTKDASTNFYFDHLKKGTYVLEYSVYVNRSGVYANGITTIQCMYAPEYTSHTQGITVTVKE